MKGKPTQRKLCNSEEWHADVLQTARALHEQIARIAELMNAVDSSDVEESFDGNEEVSKNLGNGLLSKEIRQTCVDGLHEILLKVGTFSFILLYIV